MKSKQKTNLEEKLAFSVVHKKPLRFYRNALTTSLGNIMGDFAAELLAQCDEQGHFEVGEADPDPDINIVAKILDRNHLHYRDNAHGRITAVHYSTKNDTNRDAEIEWNSGDDNCHMSLTYKEYVILGKPKVVVEKRSYRA